MDRRLWKIWGSSLLVVLAGFLITYQFVEPAPPRQLTISTGSDGGAYHAFGERYRTILAREGVDLQVVQSSGAIENVKRLLDEDSEVDVAFVQGGVTGAVPPLGLEPIASLFLEPLWIFVGMEAPPRRLGDLQGRRLAIGGEGSGTREIVTELLRANSVTADNAEFLGLGGAEAADALIEGSLDVMFLVASPTAALVQTLLQEPAVSLMSIAGAGAYTQNYRFLTTVTLAEGAIDLVANRPPADVTLLAPVASLAAREGLHPTLVDLLLLAATEVHRRGDLFTARSEFPSSRHLDLPLNQEARRYLTSGPPLLQRHLPFWAATFLERMAIMLIPLITLLIPLARILPPMLDWRIRRRICRWYDELIRVETAASTADDLDQRQALRARLDEIEQELMHLSVPRHRADLVIGLRAHVKLIRDRLAI
jgi:TRAP transporter TAXI family solute receptor